MSKITDKIYYIIGVLFLILVIPAFGATMILGNKVNYPVNSKLLVLLPSYVMLLLALFMLLVFLFIANRDKKAQMTDKQNRICNICLIVYFALLAVLNIQVCREIAFYLPLDINTVRYAAKDMYKGVEFGANPYFSMYPHNLTTATIMSYLLGLAERIPNYPYDKEFIYIQVICILFSITGYFSCLILKKLTKNIYLLLCNVGLFTLLVAASGWKISPYSDSFGIPFSAVSVYCYLCYRLSEKSWVKYVILGLAILSAVIGGWIKPSIYVILVAIFAVELLELLKEFKKKYLYFIFAIILSVGLIAGMKQVNSKIYEKIQFTPVPEIEITWHHYFAMGLSEHNTGGYDEYYTSLVVEYLDSKEARIEREMQEAKKSYAEKGVVGTVDFYIRKMVKVLDDGTFSFTVGYISGTMMQDHYEKIARNNAFTEFLRKIYWNGEYMGRYNTIMQIIWFFCMLGIPGASAVCFKKKEWALLILPVSFMGVFLYQMLFEARARYLLVFIPIVIPTAIYGMKNYLDLLNSVKRNKR